MNIFDGTNTTNLLKLFQNHFVEHDFASRFPLSIARELGRRDGLATRRERSQHRTAGGVEGELGPFQRAALGGWKRNCPLLIMWFAPP